MLQVIVFQTPTIFGRKKTDQNARHFESTIKNRERARKLIHWLFQNRSFKQDNIVLVGKEASELIFGKLLGILGAVLVQYKKIAWDAHIRGESSRITPTETCHAIQLRCEMVLDGSTIATGLNRTGRLLRFHTRSDGMKGNDEYSNGCVYGDHLVAPTFGIMIPWWSRSTGNADGPVWMLYGKKTPSEDEVTGIGYQSSTPPESPVLVTMDLEEEEDLLPASGIKRKPAIQLSTGHVDKRTKH
ncbi:hypothetical protein H0H92_002423 [Tricholoma furcatifolium]|nr:hypothetical protein H0H92_002423 [Tricholoma furcatifolium]